ICSKSTRVFFAYSVRFSNKHLFLQDKLSSYLALICKSCPLLNNCTRFSNSDYVCSCLFFSAAKLRYTPYPPPNIKNICPYPKLYFFNLSFLQQNGPIAT